MSKVRVTAGVWSSPAPRDAEGRKLCRQCLNPLPKGRAHTCSHQCSVNWRIRTSPSFARMMVWNRDHAICANCKQDAVAGHFHRNGSPVKNRARGTGDFWQVDHIVPVIEGGGECGLDGLRTLCTECHKKETAALARRRSKDGQRPPPKEVQEVLDFA